MVYLWPMLYIQKQSPRCYTVNPLSNYIDINLVQEHKEPAKAKCDKWKTKYSLKDTLLCWHHKYCKLSSYMKQVDHLEYIIYLNLELGSQPRDR